MNLQNQTPKILAIITAVTFIVVFTLVKPISQVSEYHHFANEIKLFGIQNFWNVVSNFGFILTGLFGIVGLKKGKEKNPIDSVLFLGILLTGFGSAYYHYSPNNASLVWDRLPMTLVFASFFASFYSNFFCKKIGFKIWLFNLVLGVLSVFYWQYTESINKGDLRLYAIVQFLPIILTLIIFTIHYKQHPKLLKPMLLTIVFYLLAKFLEHFDYQIFEICKIISGHPLKHIAASIATYFIFKSSSSKQI